ncbi:MAG: class I SAM-dependent methyltransferase, partial [Chromatocurvus sp.]
VAHATDFGLVRYEDITHHYPPMLRGWRDRFRERAESLTELGYPESFQRMWEFYFCYCEAAFLERHVTCAHLMLGGPRVDLHRSADGERQQRGFNR